MGWFVLLAISCQIAAYQNAAYAQDELGAAIPMLSSPLKSPAGEEFPWPEIVLVDGMSGAKQDEILKSFGRLEQFTKRSIYAPITIRADKVIVDSGTFRRYSYYFVAYGTLEQLSDKKLLTSVFDSEGGSDAEAVDLGTEGADKFDYAKQLLIKKIMLESVLQSRQLKSDRSLVACSRSLPESLDGVYLSRWAMAKDQGNLKPYDGMGVLAKATPLKSHADALFVETHIVFFEPQDWFRGKNLLGAKLPPAIQNQVRTLRRALAK